MRRLVVGLLVFLSMTAALLTVPVYAAPVPSAEPVDTSTDAVALGSVTAPAEAAEVQDGPTDPVTGVGDTSPTLTYRETDVDPFSLVGVTWAFDPAVTDTLVQVRVSDDSGGWGGWTEVSTETADQSSDAPTQVVLRGGTSPLWTGPSTGVEIELVTRSGAQPTDVQLDLVDPGSSAADSSLAAPAATDEAHADVTMPAVYSRAQWGADESLRTWAPQYASTNRAVTIHHTADSNDYTADQVPAIMRSIYRYHAVSLGWGDIGYNVVVDKYGRLWEGRSGGLASTVMGAHAGGFNTATFGVSMLGNYDVVAVPQATVESVAAFIAWKFSLFGIDPRGTVTLTSSGGGTARYAAGTAVTLPTIFAHRDVGSTACPGRYGVARMGEIRDRVAALMGAPDGPASPQITARYNAEPALRAALGPAVGGTRAEAGVIWQRYANGRLYHSAATGVRAVVGSILQAYLEAGGPAALGAPTTDEMTTPDGIGRYNHLAGGGSVYWSPSAGAQVVTGAVRDHWASLGWELGRLGYPTDDTRCGLAQGGCRQDFQGGVVGWSPATAAHVVPSGLRAGWSARAVQDGPLGYPVADAVCGLAAGGCAQDFQGGSLVWSAGSGANVVKGAIRDAWVAAGGTASWLAYPVGDETCGLAGGGCTSRFQGGTIAWSAATGPQVLNLPTQDAWTVRGRDAGPLAYPVAPVLCGLRAGGCLQQFQGGRVYWSPSSPAAVTGGAVLGAYEQRSAQDGVLGYPVGDLSCGLAAGGCAQPFQTGWLFWSPGTGARVVAGDVGAAYLAGGGAGGPLGYPTGDMLCGLSAGGCLQQFQGGRLYWSSGSGASSTRGAVLTSWEAASAQDGLYGYPVGPVACGLRDGGCTQPFERAWLVWSPATGAHSISGELGATWLAGGGSGGALGYPTGDPLCGLRDGGCLQQFQGGRLYWSAGTGTHLVRGSILGAWEAASAQDGTLGYPVGDETCGLRGGGCFTHFAGGSVYWSPTTGAHVVAGTIRDRWAVAGWESGAWGYPTGEARVIAGGQSQRFTGGTATWNTSTGAVTFG